MTIYPPPFRGPTLLGGAIHGGTSIHMNGDGYLIRILQREAVAPANAQIVLDALRPTLQGWAGQYLAGISPSGSFAKGTANRSGTDMDVFVSLVPATRETLAEIHDKLFAALQVNGYAPKRQNVSIGVKVGGLDVDIVPGKRQNLVTFDHSIYRRRGDTWTKTNIAAHVNFVRNANRFREIRTIKLWRTQKRIDLPSFYLELTVINALRGRSAMTLSANIEAALTYMRASFVDARVIDPANTNNVISDELSRQERAAISAAAGRALDGTWADFVS